MLALFTVLRFKEKFLHNCFLMDLLWAFTALTFCLFDFFEDTLTNIFFMECLQPHIASFPAVNDTLCNKKYVIIIIVVDRNTVNQDFAVSCVSRREAKFWYVWEASFSLPPTSICLSFHLSACACVCLFTFNVSRVKRSALCNSTWQQILEFQTSCPWQVWFRMTALF